MRAKSGEFRITTWEQLKKESDKKLNNMILMVFDYAMRGNIWQGVSGQIQTCPTGLGC